MKISMDSEAYHLAELAIARSRDDPRQVMPLIPRSCRSILDLGCGAGQTLIASNLEPDVLACGVDSDLAALRLGRRLSPQIQFVCGSGERLPFPSNCFDFAVSRVALPYMHIPEALAELRRVLRPGHGLWLVLHPFAMARQELIKNLCSFNLRGSLFRSYVLANGLIFHLTGKLFRFSFSGGRCESFQSAASMKRALRSAGFDQVEIRREQFFVVTARKTR